MKETFKVVRSHRKIIPICLVSIMFVEDICKHTSDTSRFLVVCFVREVNPSLTKSYQNSNRDLVTFGLVTLVK